MKRAYFAVDSTVWVRIVDMHNGSTYLSHLREDMWWWGGQNSLFCLWWETWWVWDTIFTGNFIPFLNSFLCCFIFFCLCFPWLFSHPTLRISDSILASTRLVDEGILYSLSVYMTHWRGSSIEITLKKRTFQYLKSLNFTFWTSHWDFKPHVLNKGGLPVHDLRQFQW